MAGAVLHSTGDVVSSAPELARLTLNIAATHHDSRVGGRRLVYGGHTIGLALAQASRLLPNLVTVLGWQSCDHTGPVHEGDTLYSELHVESAEPTESGGVLRLRSLVYAVSDSAGEPDRPVLDWRFSAAVLTRDAASHEHNGVVSSASSRWGSSGLAYLTGLPDGPPDFSRAHVLTRAEVVASAVGHRAGITVDAATLLTGRAALLGLTRGGSVSCGGATRLLAARDGWCAITLSRPDDVAAVPALLQADEVPADPWPALQRWAATCSVSARSSSGRVCSTSPRPRWARSRPRRHGYDEWDPRAPAPGIRRPAGGRPVIDVGRPAVRAAAGPRWSDRRQGRESRAARTAPGAAIAPSSTG